MPDPEPIKILLIEDNEGDRLLTRIAFQKSDIPAEITEAKDGVEAMKILRNQNTKGMQYRPDIVLSDINMPRMDGKQVLKEIKEDENLKVIPVIMLSSSDAHIDILESYRHYANAYIVKPLTSEKFLEVAQKIEDFWLKISRLPILQKI